jgi:hypothetical protein
MIRFVMKRSLLATALGAGLFQSAAMAQPPGYKYAGPFGDPSGRVSLGAGSVTIGSITVTPPNDEFGRPPAPGAILVKVGHATGNFWFHENSPSAEPDRLTCCLSGAGESECTQWDVPDSYPTEGGGSHGWSAPIQITEVFPYSGKGAFTATLSCSVASAQFGQGQAPPLNGNSYGFVTTAPNTLKAVYLPAQTLP